jgi:hypothetical protein
MEEPAEYLRELLLKMLEALHARPVVADLVVLRLSSVPILDPLLAERLLLTLAAPGVPGDALPKMFQQAMGVIFEMILIVSARSKAADQKRLSEQMHKAIAALPPTEFPNLTQLREALVAETVEAGASKPNQRSQRSMLTYSSQSSLRVNRTALSNRPSGRPRAFSTGPRAQ